MSRAAGRTQKGALRGTELITASYSAVVTDVRPSDTFGVRMRTILGTKDG